LTATRKQLACNPSVAADVVSLPIRASVGGDVIASANQERNKKKKRRLL